MIIEVFWVKAMFTRLPLSSFWFPSFRADHEKNDNVISAPFISHARPKRSNSITESSQTPRPYLPCWANIVLKSHAPIVLDESCTAQLDNIIIMAPCVRVDHPLNCWNVYSGRDPNIYYPPWPTLGPLMNNNQLAVLRQHKHKSHLFDLLVSFYVKKKKERKTVKCTAR